MAYTEAQLKEAARKAYAAGDTAAAKRFIAEARKAASAAPVDQGQAMRERIAAAKSGTLQMQPGSAERAAAANEQATAMMRPERTVGQTIYENVIGSGAVDTPGERLGELIRGAGAATARGIADVPAIPANLAQLGAAGVEYALGMEQPSMVSRGLAALPDTREMLASVPVIGPESRYVAPGLLGKYISTAGEFAGGAGALAGPRAILRYGVVPGVASEAAGQATEGTALEPYARAAAALVAPFAAGAAGKAAQTVISPSAGQITPGRQAAVDFLRREGVQPTAGQVVGGTAAKNQLYREAATTSGRAKADKALEDFTSAVMEKVGSPRGTMATDDALVAAEARLKDVYSSVLSNTNVAPGPADLTNMNSAIKTFRDLAPKDRAPGIFEDVSKALSDASKKKTTIPGENVYSWRKKFSKLTKSQDDAVRDAAIEAVEAIDDLIEGTLTAAGRTDDIARFGTARGQFRNLFAVEKAAERAGIEGAISPLALRTALLQQGRRRYVQGKGDLGPITRAAADILSPLPESGTSPRISAGQVLSGAPTGGAAGLGAFGIGLDPLTATAIGAATTVAPIARNQFLSSNPGQRYFQNQLLKEFGPIVDQRMVGVTPGIMPDEQDFARGGDVKLQKPASGPLASISQGLRQSAMRSAPLQAMARGQRGML